MCLGGAILTHPDEECVASTRAAARRSIPSGDELEQPSHRPADSDEADDETGSLAIEVVAYPLTGVFVSPDP